jgi:hypothetical protein
VNRSTVNYYYNKIRKILLLASLQEGGIEIGDFELDESYFGAKRVQGKRGARGGREDADFRAVKTRREGFRKNCSKDEPLPVIQAKSLKSQSFTRTDIRQKIDFR